MSRVLLTGATGFVGRQVLKRLLARGATVTAVVRPGAPHLAGATRLEVEDAFAEDAAFWSNAASSHDTVCHVAWYVEPGDYLHSPRNLACLAGTLRLAEGAADAGIRRFVGVGTCFEYDLGSAALARGKPLDVDAPLNPVSAYGAAKAAAWLALSRTLPPLGISFAWCRLFYLHGEGEDPRRLVPYLHARLSAGEPAELTSGRQVRDFLDVAVAGDRIAAAALGTGEGALNICSGEPVTVADFARRIAEGHGRPDLLRLGARPDRPDDPPFVLGIPTPIEETR